MERAPLEQLEEKLGHAFADRELLVHALTHSSRKSELEYSNERLEFLGDSILGVAVSDHLYRLFDDFTEGDLTRVKSRVVSHDTLIRIAKDLELGRFLNVAKGVAQSVEPATPSSDDDPGVERILPESLVSDALEAIIAAVYLDAGMDKAHTLVIRLLHDQIETASRSSHVHNFKSALQQYAQRKLGLTPQYRVVAEEGPDHVKSFDVVTEIGRETYGRGKGKTKKAAEQMAAKRTLAIFERADADVNDQDEADGED